jgi:hypothetical protein
MFNHNPGLFDELAQVHRDELMEQANMYWFAHQAKIERGPFLRRAAGSVGKFLVRAGETLEGYARMAEECLQERQLGEVR